MHRTPGPGLPSPDKASSEHSQRCALHIRDLMDGQGGSLSFAEFMREALYAPGLGYYAAGATKFGRAGDFVTAPEISPLFGRTVAVVCADILATIVDGDVLEFGAGSGRLAVDVLSGLADLGRLPRRYLIIELSAELRERQARLLAEELPQLADRVHWLEQLPVAHRGVVLANEVLDAMPVERFRIERGVKQLRVQATANGFAGFEAPAPPELEAAVAAIEREIGGPFAQGYTSEVSPLLEPWIASVCGMLAEGVVLLFDYGVSRREYYAPDRRDGWLRCHYRHRAHDNPFILPGIQDITSWVDFSAAASAAIDSGADVAGYAPQAGFLFAAGVVEVASTMRPSSHRAQSELASQLKMLTLPGEMGEHFKCLGLARGVTALPPALTIPDRTHTL